MKDSHTPRRLQSTFHSLNTTDLKTCKRVHATPASYLYGNLCRVTNNFKLKMFITSRFCRRNSHCCLYFDSYFLLKKRVCCGAVPQTLFFLALFFF